MTRAGNSHGLQAGAPQLWWSFIIIVIAFVIGNLVSIFEMRNSQAQVRLITKHAASNIEVVARLSRDLDQKRFLVQNHIFEKEPRDMDRIEAQIADVNADIAEASRSYEAIGDEETEHAAWQQLTTEIAAMEPQIAHALSLSAQNVDSEAQAEINMIDARFQVINRDTDTLLALNHARANNEVAHVRALQRGAVIFLAALTLVLTVFALLTARWSTRLINEREHQMRTTMNLLEERNRELDAFAGRVAHDLRGPLTTINLAASAIGKHGARDEASDAVLRRGVARMEAMIQDLLTLSRVSAQVIGSTCETSHVAELVREDLKPIVENAGGTLKIDAAAATVSSNEGLLRQVLWNLGENAVKYRRADVPLRLKIFGRITPKAYELSVSDNGKGMSSAEVRQAFEPFFRGREEQTTTGTGLGLSIVKRVIEASGGSVSVDSAVGRGTTFTIQLPFVADKMAA
jgi:signal transduction histidine kinase